MSLPPGARRLKNLFVGDGIAADPSIEAEFVDQIEHVVIIQFPMIGLSGAPASTPAILHVADAFLRQVLPEGLHAHVSFHNLAVIQIHLHFECGVADLVDNRVRFVLPIQEIAGMSRELIGSISSSNLQAAPAQPPRVRLATKASRSRP